MPKFNLESFLKKSPEEQAKQLEKDTQRLLNRLSSLKKNLKMYGETTSELYNLESDEVDQLSKAWSNAVRRGEVSTPSSKAGYKKFVKDLMKYARPNVHDLAVQTAEQRLSSWLEHVKANGSLAEIQYAEEMINSMTDSQKIGFTTSQYFLDVENWSSQGFVREDDEGNEYSIQTLKLELYLKTYGVNGKNIYNDSVASDGIDKMRPAVRGGRVKKRS